MYYRICHSTNTSFRHKFGFVVYLCFSHTDVLHLVAMRLYNEFIVLMMASFVHIYGIQSTQATRFVHFNLHSNIPNLKLYLKYLYICRHFIKHSFHMGISLQYFMVMKICIFYSSQDPLPWNKCRFCYHSVALSNPLLDFYFLLICFLCAPVVVQTTETYSSKKPKSESLWWVIALIFYYSINNAQEFCNSCQEAPYYWNMKWIMNCASFC